ncbi:M28 family peptidase [Metamycoplasma canadense]|uniref:Peptidase M28 domain-containing protein n=1 Tax=Metamycoplasma canadense TaxID=29554 RepID=A0A077L563_9BACT|nr:M28 family peptidase [Metamycoplasma canadense]BAP39425.1 hypothetical protein MCAN360_0176 [Metamycoplasma canadense]
MKKLNKFLLSFGSVASLVALPTILASCADEKEKSKVDEELQKIKQEYEQKLSELKTLKTTLEEKIKKSDETNTELSEQIKKTNEKIEDLQKMLVLNKLNESEKVMYKLFSDLLNTTHGRKAGNLNNFKKELLDATTKEIKLENGKRLTTEIVEKNLLYKFGDDTNKPKENISNYGSYYAYEYLKKQIKDMGYQELDNGQITYPEYNKKQISLKKHYLSIYDAQKDKAVIDNMNENIKKDGFFTNGFLFDFKENNLKNNVGNNIVVTINPTGKAKDKNPKDFYIVSHFDSTNNVGPKGVSWGATDNATGVTVNLRLLKHFADVENRKKLAVRLHLIFVDAEELGKLGSYAFVNQFLTGENNELLKNSLGMINMDTVAGGDYMYIHSPKTSPDHEAVLPDSNLSKELRDLINKVSKDRATKLKDNEQELQIHPQYSGAYKEGETGDWSDHAPFYQIAKLPVAYVESTNFSILSKYEVYDGYAQTMNPKAWVLKDGTTIPSLKKRVLEDKKTVVYDWPDGLKKEDFAILGDIWHSDLDTLEWVNKNIGSKIYKQLDTVFETLKELLTNNLGKVENEKISYPELNKQPAIEESETNGSEENSDGHTGDGEEESSGSSEEETV